MVLAGREEEISKIESLIAMVRDGGRRGLVLVGPPGIGKSFLIKQAKTCAIEKGMPAATIRATGPALPLQVTDYLVAIITQLNVGAVDPPPLRAESRSSDLAKLLRQLDENPSPCFISIDDVDRLPREVGRPLLEALRSSQRPMAVLLSANSIEAQSMSPEPSGDLWYELRRLEGLSLNDIFTLAQDHAQVPLLPSVAKTLFRQSYGNPLLALELIRSWLDEERLQLVGRYLAWNEDPPRVGERSSVHEAAGVRLSGLPVHARELLLTMALLDRPTSLEELRQVTNTPDITRDLMMLRKAGFIVESELGSITYRIAQPVYAESIVQQEGRTIAATIHARLFRMLNDEGASAAELAHHGIASIDQPANLAEVVHAAATEAEALGQYLRAARWYGELLLLKDDARAQAEGLLAQGTAQEHFDPLAAFQTFSNLIENVQHDDLRVRALIGRASAARRLGRYSEGKKDLMIALDQAFRATDRFEIRHALAVHAGISRNFDEARQQLAELLDTAPTESHRGNVLAHLAQVAYSEGDVTRAASQAEASLSLKQDGADAAFARSNLAWYLIILGNWERASSLLREGIDEAERSGDLWNLLNLLADEARLLSWVGRITEGIDRAAEAIRIAKVLASPVDQLHASDALATGLVELGDYEGATQALERAMNLGSQPVEPRDLALTYTLYAEALLGNGALTPAERALDRAVDQLIDAPVFVVLVDAVRASIAARRGDAREALDHVSKWLDKPSVFMWGQARVAETAGLAHMLAGDSKRALDLMRLALSKYLDLGASKRAEKVEAWLARQTARIAGRPRSDLPFGLTKREMEVLWLTTRGMTAREIALNLFISEGTVRKHLENIKLKAGVSRKAEVVVFASRLGITPECPPAWISGSAPPF